MIKIIVFMFVLMWYANCHEHHDESASYKYSYEANKNVPKKQSSHSGCGNKHIHEHNPYHSKHTEQKSSIDINDVWLFSLGSTLMISVAPFLLLFLIPLDNTDSMKPRLKLLLAFASGGLLGDAFLHLIPHAIHPHSHHDHDHNHDHDHKHHENSHSGSHDQNMTIGLWVLCGIVVFLAVEKFVRFFKGSAGHSHGPSNTENTAKRLASGDHKKNATDSKRNVEKIDISGYLNLAADFAHNFTDGLAIGASYYAGYNIGLVTTMTILLHEVPHEIGDFAILIKSGCSRRKALLLQLVTALGAFAGNILALVGTNPDADTAPWFLPFTAGGFIYIATVSVLPELLEESTKLGQSIKEITALLTGVGLMVIIANFE